MNTPRTKGKKSKRDIKFSTSLPIPHPYNTHDSLWYVNAAEKI
jgi:hypothetical protein